MKRFWIGIGVLAALLIAGWITTTAIERCHAPISQALEQACQAALEGNWAQAVAYSEEAEQKWQRCRDFTAAFTDHDILEEMESLFSEAQVFRQAEDMLSFAAVCAHLSRLADAVAQSHLPKWQNLL